MVKVVISNSDGIVLYESKVFLNIDRFSRTHEVFGNYLLFVYDLSLNFDINTFEVNII